MSKKKENIKKTKKSKKDTAYSYFDDKAVEAFGTISFTSGFRDSFENIESNISSRSSFTRRNYERFRPNESIPKKPKEIIQACMEAYRKVGIVRNVIDLMGDFGSQGIKLVHPNPTIQKFYKNWFKKVHGLERSERFLNLLYRSANVIVQRKTAKITISDKKLLIAQGKLHEDEDFPKDIEITKSVIPIKYIFLNPLNIEVTNPELLQFFGLQQLSLKVTSILRQAVVSPSGSLGRNLIRKLPADMIKVIKSGGDVIPLDMEKVSSYYYKKDDWKSWADPLVYSIMDDLILLEKMKLADLAALDTAISQVRLWSLGDLEKGIIPTDTAINKLNNMLMTNAGGGGFDIIWGPDLKISTLDSEVHKFLGSEKYDAPLNSIYAGLGVPPTLTGSSNASGFTNNFISLKTLINRLEYGRSILREFWQKEIELVRKAMGFKEGAQIQFDHMALTDEAAEKKLLMDLWDRNIISDEGLLCAFNQFPDLELLRNRREVRQRKRGNRPPKAGPYANPEKLHDLIKIALQKGLLAPEDVGIGVDDVNMTPFKQQIDSVNKRMENSQKNKGESGEGRPLNSRDKNGRKSKAPSIRTSANNVGDLLGRLVWTKNAQSFISDTITPFILKHYNKKNLRQLSSDEISKVENLKFGVLSNIEYGTDLTKDKINYIIKGGAKLNKSYKTIYSKFLSDFSSKKSPTLEDKRMMQVISYSLVKEIENA